MLATIDQPSFAAFPWRGVILLLCFAGLTAACAAVLGWARREGDRLDLPAAGIWDLAFKGLLAGLVVSVFQLGPRALVPGAASVAAAAVLFTRKRDSLVAPDQRLLTTARLAGVKQDLLGYRSRRAALAEARRAAKQAAGGPPRDLKARLAGLFQRKAKKPAPADAASPPPVLKLMKKDGTPVFGEDGAASGDRASENVRHARQMLLDAMRAQATDIHLEAHEQGYAVRYRVDGVLQDANKIDAAVGRGVVSALKVLADMNIAERRRPQDGTFAALLGDSKYDIRVASTPSSYGEKVVMRLLNSSGGVLSAGLESLGLRSQVLKQLREVIHRPYGMFIVAGPTGSGKTTTVYGSLSEIDAHTHNITTIEDPVEYRLDNITQIAVNSQAGVSFASILRSVLRQDPDVLLVGEIRDRETAEIACQAALTGHFVFSTVHANDSIATVTRLLDLGLDPTLLQTALSAVLAQRLARRLCTACREPYPTPPELRTRFKLAPEQVPVIYREKGCEKCNGSGYRGRMGIHELLVFNEDICKLITPQPSVNDLRLAAARAGAQFLKVDGMLKVLKGLTSISEIQRVTN